MTSFAHTPNLFDRRQHVAVSDEAAKMLQLYDGIGFATYRGGSTSKYWGTAAMVSGIGYRVSVNHKGRCFTLVGGDGPLTEKQAATVATYFYMMRDQDAVKLTSLSATACLWICMVGRSIPSIRPVSSMKDLLRYSSSHGLKREGIILLSRFHLIDTGSVTQENYTIHQERQNAS